VSDSVAHELDGRRVLVTVGATGIGAAAVEAFGAHGATDDLDFLIATNLKATIFTNQAAFTAMRNRRPDHRYRFIRSCHRKPDRRYLRRHPGCRSRVDPDSRQDLGLLRGYRERGGTCSGNTRRTTVTRIPRTRRHDAARPTTAVGDA